MVPTVLRLLIRCYPFRCYPLSHALGIPEYEPQRTYLEHRVFVFQTGASPEGDRYGCR